MSMPMAPPDTRAAGQAGHITDHNTISDALDWLGNAVGALQAQESAPAAAGLLPGPVQTGSFAASPAVLYPCDLSTGSFTGALPPAPPDGSRVAFKVINTSPLHQYVLTVTSAGTDVFNKAGGSTSLGLVLLNQGMILQYSASSGIWYVTSDDMPLGSVRQIIPDWFHAKAYGATGGGVVDDTIAINAALAAAGAQGGGVVYLPWGTYLVSGPLSIPPYVFLVGETAISLNFFTTPGGITRIVASPSWAPSSSTGIIQVLSKTPGGWAVNTASCGVRNVFIDGSQNTSSNLQGISLTGPAYDVHLDDVFIWKAPHDGITTSGFTESGIGPNTAYHVRINRVTIASSGFTGFAIGNMTDTDLTGCLAFGNAADGYNMQNMSNTKLNGCRAEWNSGRGFEWTLSGGSCSMTGCTTDQNSDEGIRIHAATGQSNDGGGIIITGGKLHGDGRGGSPNANGIKVTGSTVPVTISGVNVESSSTSGTTYPTVALEIDTSSNVIVTGCTLQGATSGFTDGGGNGTILVDNCELMTGSPGSQVSSLRTARVNVPRPVDAGLLAWNMDPFLIGSSTALTGGNVYLLRVDVHQPVLVTNIVAAYVTAGSGLTTAECFAGLYNSSGQLVGQTADQSTAWGGTAQKLLPMALAGGPFYLADGFYWVAYLANGTTPPVFGRASSIANPADYVNSLLTPATYKIANLSGAQTTLPASFTPSSLVQATVQEYFAGLS